MLLLLLINVQGSAKVGAPGLVNFITTVAYHFCPNVPYPGTGLKGRTDGLTDGLASKHIPSYQQKHRIKILKHLSATFTC